MLAAILCAYLVAGVCYARFTPPWQAPDEPAHFNYVRYVAERGALPVLTMGDYPHQYLEEIKARRFPADMSIDSIRYEFHQPPLYYVLAAGVYWLVGGRLLGLRLLSVALGSGLLVTAWGLLRSIVPQRPDLALGATAVMAFAPMHLAMTAAVNNDVLAELLLVASVLSLVRHLRAPRQSWLRAVGVGLLLGLGLLTKATVFIAIPLAAVAIFTVPGAHHNLESGLGQRGVRWRALNAALILGIAGLVLLPWLIRNQAVYGDLDLLGLRRHSQVVIGQPRTAEWLADKGTAAFIQSFVKTTFRSFWGQFGWMGVVLDSRIYLFLGILSGLAALGILLLLTRKVQIGRGPVVTIVGAAPAEGWLTGVFVLWIALTAGSYLWYNLRFVQHQGRYLFPALVPLSMFFAAGLHEVLSRSRALLVAGVCLTGACSLVLMATLGAGTGQWPVWMLAGTGVGFALRRVLPGSWGTRVQVAPYLGLFALDWVSLFGFIVPYLS